MDAQLQADLERYAHWIGGEIIGGDDSQPRKVTAVEVQYGKAALRLEDGYFIVAREATLVRDANGKVPVDVLAKGARLEQFDGTDEGYFLKVGDKIDYFDTYDGEGRVFYTPVIWPADGRVGYAVRSTEAPGKVEFIYFNPTENSEPDTPTVFVYQGAEGDPVQDGSVSFFEVGEIVLEPEFGEVELTEFQKDPMTEDFPEGVQSLYEIKDGALFEDAEGRLFNRVGHGPVQGSVEIIDDDEIHAYWDVGTKVRLHERES